MTPMQRPMPTRDQVAYAMFLIRERQFTPVDAAILTARDLHEAKRSLEDDCRDDCVMGTIIALSAELSQMSFPEGTFSEADIVKAKTEAELVVESGILPPMALDAMMDLPDGFFTGFLPTGEAS